VLEIIGVASYYDLERRVFSSLRYTVMVALVFPKQMGLEVVNRHSKMAIFQLLYNSRLPEEEALASQVVSIYIPSTSLSLSLGTLLRSLNLVHMRTWSCMSIPCIS
jgi:hypothetical protein